MKGVFSSDLGVKWSVPETNFLVTSIHHSPSHMWNALLVTSLGYFFTISKFLKTKPFVR